MRLFDERGDLRMPNRSQVEWRRLYQGEWALPEGEPQSRRRRSP